MKDDQVELKDSHGHVLMGDKHCICGRLNEWVEFSTHMAYFWGCSMCYQIE